MTFLAVIYAGVTGRHLPNYIWAAMCFDILLDSMIKLPRFLQGAAKLAHDLRIFGHWLFS